MVENTVHQKPVKEREKPGNGVTWCAHALWCKQKDNYPLPENNRGKKDLRPGNLKREQGKGRKRERKYGQRAG